MAKLKQSRLNRKVDYIIGLDGGYSIIDPTELRSAAVEMSLTLEDGIKAQSSKDLTSKHSHLAARFIILLKSSDDLSTKTKVSYLSNIKPFFNFLDERIDSPITLKNINNILARQFIQYLRNTYPDSSTGSQRTRWKVFKWFFDTAFIYLNSEVSDDVLHKKMPKNPFKNEHKTAKHAEPYSDTEFKQIMEALQAAYKSSLKGQDDFSLSVRVAIILARTGFNVSSVLTMPRNPLIPHPIDSRKEILIGGKPRARRHVKQIIDKAPEDCVEERTAVGKNVSALVREILANNQLLSLEGDEIDALTIYQDSNAEILQLSNHVLNNNLNKVSEKFNLRDSKNKILTIRGTRLRATFGKNNYKISGSVIEVSKLLNHSSSINLAANAYISTSKEDELKFSFVGKVIEDRARNNNSGRIPSIDMTKGIQPPEILATSVAKCSDSKNGTYAPKNGQTCTCVLECFSCEQMTVFRNDLHRLLSFYYAIKNEKERISIAVWTKRFLPILQIIDLQILPQFHESYVETARIEAINNPHPIWAQPGILNK